MNYSKNQNIDPKTIDPRTNDSFGTVFSYRAEVILDSMDIAAWMQKRMSSYFDSFEDSTPGVEIPGSGKPGIEVGEGRETAEGKMKIKNFHYRTKEDGKNISKKGN